MGGGVFTGQMANLVVLYPNGDRIVVVLVIPLRNQDGDDFLPHEFGRLTNDRPQRVLVEGFFNDL